MGSRAILAAPVVAMLLAGITSSQGAAPAFDAASSYSSWTNGSNKGTGWKDAWVLTTSGSGSGGSFVGSSTNNASGDGNADGDINSPGAKAWGVWASGGKYVEAARDFNGALTVGQAISVYVDNGYINSGSSVGFLLATSNGTPRFEFKFAGGATNYVINDSQTNRPTGLAFSGEGLRIELTLTATNSYSVTILQHKSGGSSITMTGILAGTSGIGIERIRLYNNNAGSGSAYDAFFNVIRIGPKSSDFASGTVYNDDWQTGDNTGTGWSGGWSLSGSGTYGQFIGDSATNGGFDTNGDGDINTVGRNTAGPRSWGMYASGGGLCDATRPFTNLAVGESFEIRMDNGYVDVGGTVGFGLRNTNNQNRFEFYFNGGATNYVINDASGERPTGIPFSSEGVFIQFTLTDSNTYTVAITRMLGGATTISGTLAGSNAISKLRLFNFNAGTGPTKDQYFNSIGIGPRIGPLIACPSDISQSVACGTNLVSVSFTGIVSVGACPVPTNQPTYSVASGSGFGVGTTPVTCTVTDKIGNTARCIFSVIISSVETNPPVFSNVPTNTTVECGTNENAYLSSSCSPVTAYDDCDGDRTANISCTIVRDPQAVCPPYIISRRWSVQDMSGNGVAATQLVTVVDTIAPIFTFVPTNVSVQCDGSVPTASVASVSVTDNCDRAAITVTISAVSTGSCPRIITRTWVATDFCSNQVSATQTVTVSDTTSPTLICPSTQYVWIPITTNQIAVSFNTPSATDNCTNAVTVTCSPTSGTVFALGTSTVTCTALDACGNTSTCAFQVVVFTSEGGTLGWCRAGAALDGYVDSSYTLITESGFSVPARDGATNHSDYVGELSARSMYTASPETLVDVWTEGAGADIEDFYVTWDTNYLYLAVKGPTCFHSGFGPPDRGDLFIAIDVSNTPRSAITPTQQKGGDGRNKLVDFAGWSPTHFIGVEYIELGGTNGLADIRWANGAVITNDVRPNTDSNKPFEFNGRRDTAVTEFKIAWDLLGGQPSLTNGLPWNFAVYVTANDDGYDTYDNAPGMGQGTNNIYQFESLGDTPYDGDHCAVTNGGTGSTDPVTSVFDTSCGYSESDHHVSEGIENGVRLFASDNTGSYNNNEVDTIQDYISNQERRPVGHGPTGTKQCPVQYDGGL